MDLIALAAGLGITLLVVGARLWWDWRSTVRRRRSRDRRWWAAYRLRLPAVLMARWPKGRTLAYHPDRAA